MPLTEVQKKRALQVLETYPMKARSSLAKSLSKEMGLSLYMVKNFVFSVRATKAWETGKASIRKVQSRR